MSRAHVSSVAPAKPRAEARNSPYTDHFPLQNRFRTKSLPRQKAAVAPVSGEFLPSIKERPATGTNGSPKINMSALGREAIQQSAKRASRALTSVRRFRTPPLRDLAEAGKRKQGSLMGAPKGRPGSGWDS